MNDLRYAFRMLFRRPGLTAVITASLALGIGANSFIFSMLSAILLSPLPFKEPERLVTVFESNPKAGMPRGAASHHWFLKALMAGEWQSPWCY